MQAKDAGQGDGPLTRGISESIQYSKASSTIGADGLLDVRPDTEWHQLVRPQPKGCLRGQSAVNDLSLGHQVCFPLYSAAAAVACVAADAPGIAGSSAGAGGHGGICEKTRLPPLL